MTITYSPEAIDDLVDVATFAARDNPAAATKLADRVMDMIDQLARGGLDGPEHELVSGGRVRSWPVPPLRIYYRREADDLQIVRIYHQARRPIVR